MEAAFDIQPGRFEQYEILPHPDDVPLQIKRQLKHVCEKSPLAFTRVFHRVREQTNFLISAHHWIFSQVIQKVFDGEIKRLIVNVPPGYTKTVQFVVDFIARGLAINPYARFVHATYSKTLALDNSSAIKETIQSDWYQSMWPLKLKDDTQAKGLWRTEQGGGLLAAPAGGSITGFRAGRMLDGFHGAFIMDDAIKPDDAFSDPIRKKINRRFTNTFKSRLNTEDIPFIVIGQRIHPHDPTDFLLRGGSGEKWYHLELPAEIGEKPAPYPDYWTHGIRIDYELPEGPLWPEKQNQEQLDILKADGYTWSAQYQQRPRDLGGEIFDSNYWRFYKKYDPSLNYIELLSGERIYLEYINIYVDTAMKAEERHDYSVFQVWGKGEDGRIYLLDQYRGKWTSPKLHEKALEIFDEWSYKYQKRPLGVRDIKVEDKVSGTGLIADINNERGEGYVTGIPRSIDKVSRAKSSVIPISMGKVVLPIDAWFTPGLIEEHREFKDDDSHRYDDQIDCQMDATHDMILAEEGINYRGVA
jgi:predicted phage terminase large subunit-like protein